MSAVNERENRHGHGGRTSYGVITKNNRYSRTLSTSCSSLVSSVATKSVAPSLYSVSTVSTACTSSTRASGASSAPSSSRSLHSTSSSGAVSSAWTNASTHQMHFSDCYSVVRQIGNKGAYSTVWQAVHKETKERVAVKVIKRKRLSALEDAAVFEEVDILRYLTKESSKPQHRRFEQLRNLGLSPSGTTDGSNGGVIKLLDFFVTPRTFYIVTELMECGDVFDQIVKRGRFAEGEAQQLITSLLRAVKLLHDKKVAHRDLKPENMLLCRRAVKPATVRRHSSTSSTASSSAPTTPSTCGEGRRRHSENLPYGREEEDEGRTRRREKPKMSLEVKLADLGLAAKVAKPRSLVERCGTPMYVAPEVLRGKPYDQSCDMWSVGVILYFLISGCPPFIDNSRRGLFMKIVSGQYTFEGEGWDSISTEAKDLIARLLTVDPTRRITADQALKHEFIRRRR